MTYRMTDELKGSHIIYDDASGRAYAVAIPQWTGGYIVYPVGTPWFVSADNMPEPEKNDHRALKIVQMLQSKKDRPE